jgi:transcription termination/antitermination protein NusG
MEHVVAEKKWYVLRVISGKEKKTKEYLDKEISRSGWDKIISQVLVPMEKVYKIKDGKKQIKERNYFPGYILLEADDKKMSGEVLHTVKGVTGVINFLGNNTPTALRKSEVNKILGIADESIEAGVTIEEPYLVGESVKITDGPFNNFNGTIDEISEEKKRLKVSVLIFGRKTPVELTYNQVEKIAQ